MKKLSIIIPVYNVEKYLEECLNSVYKIKLDKEVILVNDGSLDNSLKILRKYKEKYDEETIIIDQENKGLSGARNSGLKIAKGEYISFIDSDDMVLPDVYKEVYEKGKLDNLDIIIGTGSYYYSGSEVKNFRRNKKLSELGIITGKNYLIQSSKLRSYREEVWDDFYKREFLIKNNLKFKEGIYHEDVLFSFEAFIKSERVRFYNYPFYLYRQRENSITKNMNIKNYIDKKIILLEMLKIIDKEKFYKFSKQPIGLYLDIVKNVKEVSLDVINKLIYLKNKDIMDYCRLMRLFYYYIKYKSNITFNKK